MSEYGPTAVNSPKLTKLEERKQALQEAIAKEKKDLRERDKRRERRRRYVLGEAVERLQEAGGLDERLLTDLKTELMSVADGRRSMLDACSGTPFDIGVPVSEGDEID